MEFPTATLTSLLKKAASDYPHRRALFVPGRLTLTHSTLDRLVDDAASFLSSCGIRQGDVVALAFPNTVEFVITFLAVIRSRAVAAPLNSVYTKDEFGFYLSDAEARVLITNTEGNSAAEFAATKLRIPHATAVLGSSLAITPFSVRPTKEDGSSAAPPPAAGSSDPSDMALFLHTSGTTSRPKGVPLTQSNLAASARNITLSYGLSPGDSTVLVLPLFHVHGLVAALLSSLAAAASVTLPASGRFSASSFWSDMAASSATWYTAVPTIHQILLDRHDAAPEPKPAYPPLRFIRSCSAALAPAVLQRLEEAFKAPVLEAYAMTEASHQMTTNPLEGRRVGSVGRATGAVEVAVLGEEGERCLAGVHGEVCVRGPNVTRGYKRNPEANKAAFQYGWFHTGDVGYLDGDGYLYLVARIKELINRGGEKISPIEVDAVLLSHPDVAQAVAFGVPDDKYGEEIICAVVPREGEKIDEAELQHFCRKNLAAFKVPKKVFVADSLPKTATGKIQRRVVAEHFLSQISVAKVPKFGA